MGSTISSSNEEIEKRRCQKANNYRLSNMLVKGNISSKHKILYLSVYDSRPILESYFSFLVRYHHDPCMLHSLIIQQTKYIIQILKILNDYDDHVNGNSQTRLQSMFHCRAIDSCKWIMSTYHNNMYLTHDQGKKIGNVWNDNATQTLMVLIEKYEKVDNNNNNECNDNNNDISDFHYYNHIKSYLNKEYPINSEFCRYFMSNISKFCFKEMSIENHKERKLFLKCLTQNGKIPLSKRDLTINGYQLSVFFVSFYNHVTV